MSIRLLLAALAVVAVPVAVLGQQPAPDPNRKPWPERRYCEVYNHIGSRLEKARRCYSKAQRDQMRYEARQATEHAQIIKTHAH